MLEFYGFHFYSRYKDKYGEWILFLIFSLQAFALIVFLSSVYGIGNAFASLVVLRFFRILFLIVLGG